MYDAFSHPPDPDVGTEPRRSIYRNVGKPQHGEALVKTPFSGIVEENGEKIQTDEMIIALTQWGDKGPIVLFLHGVPTNRRQWRPVQERLAPFCRTIAIDMLGMGESDKPLQYGKDQDVAAVARAIRLPKAKSNNPYKPCYTFTLYLCKTNIIFLRYLHLIHHGSPKYTQPNENYKRPRKRKHGEFQDRSHTKFDISESGALLEVNHRKREVSTKSHSNSYTKQINPTNPTNPQPHFVDEKPPLNNSFSCYIAHFQIIR